MGRLLSEPEGRAWAYDFLSTCHLYGASLATNALALAFREGERSVGMRLWEAFEDANPDACLLMLKEAHNERRRLRDLAEHAERDTSDDEPDA